MSTGHLLATYREKQPKFVEFRPRQFRSVSAEPWDSAEPRLKNTGLARAIAKVPRTPKLGDSMKIAWRLFYLSPKKTQSPYFRGFSSTPRHCTSNTYCTVLWAYNIGARAGIFLGVRRIFVRIARKIVVRQTLPLQIFLSQKTCRLFFGVTQKKYFFFEKKSNSEVFHQSASLITQIEQICRNIYVRIFRNFARILDKSKLLGVFLHTHLLHHWHSTSENSCFMTLKLLTMKNGTSFEPTVQSHVTISMDKPASLT